MLSVFPECLAIETAAMEMLGGGEALEHCRKAEIMSDAAYVVLTRDSKSRTGEFLIDEDVLREVGVTDFEQYACVPGIVGAYEMNISNLNISPTLF